MSRSIRPEVRNWLLTLPEAKLVADLPPEAKQAWIAVCLGIRRAAKVRAEKLWRSHKAPMATYWYVVGVLAGHAARLAR